MIDCDRRVDAPADRRSMPRGGRRTYDVPGRYPLILVAESYEAVRGPCAAYLSLLNFEVAETAVAKEAVAVIESGWVPHLILADLASAHLLSHLPAPSQAFVPALIVMTSSPATVRPRKGALLVKPFRLKEMLTTVRRVLHRMGPVAPPLTLAPPRRPNPT
jgi:DNA-binding response OmpR family regulator